MAIKRHVPHVIAIEGMEELLQNLKGVLPREAKNLARSTVHAIAGKVRNEIRRNAPVETGELRKSVVTVRRRGTATEVASDVIVENDAFYWRFIEYGTQNQLDTPFIDPAVEKIRPTVPEEFRKEFGIKLERLMARKAKKLK